MAAAKSELETRIKDLDKVINCDQFLDYSESFQFNKSAVLRASISLELFRIVNIYRIVFVAFLGHTT